MRAAELPGMTSRLLSDLFPDTPPIIYPAPDGADRVRRAAEQALAGVDFSRVKPTDSINICASATGFTLFGGIPFREMIRAIREVVAVRTGCSNIRFRLGGGLRFREPEEQIATLELDRIFDGKAKAIAALDTGIPIETEIGTVWGLKGIYDATWIVHVHTSDVRELHFHRQIDRALKPFAMSYARGETRSIYHQNLGPTVANFLSRMIFESEFVQSKYLASCFLIVSPAGVVGVDADNDLTALNRRVTVAGFRYYGKILRLFGAVEDCVAILDAPAPVPYVAAGGMIYGNFLNAKVDLFDLSVKLPPYTWYTESFHDRKHQPLSPVLPLNPAVKACIHNYAWVGYPSAFFPTHIPTLVVGAAAADLFRRDSQNENYMDHAEPVPDLPGALERACREAGTQNVLIFDHAVGGFNCSPDLARILDAAAPAAGREVDEHLMAHWLSQRGLGPEALIESDNYLRKG